MMLLRKLWADDAGFIVSSELVLISTILVIGLVVGLTAIRNQVVQELVDYSQAIGAVAQGYEVHGTQKLLVATTDAFSWNDLSDFCQSATVNTDVAATTAGTGFDVSVIPVGGNTAPTAGEGA